MASPREDEEERVVEPAPQDEAEPQAAVEQGEEVQDEGDESDDYGDDYNDEEEVDEDEDDGEEEASAPAARSGLTALLLGDPSAQAEEEEEEEDEDEDDGGEYVPQTQPEPTMSKKRTIDEVAPEDDAETTNGKKVKA